MASVRESSVQPPSSSPMQQLGWLIGDWETKRDETTVRASFRWIVEKRFIERKYTAGQGGKEISSGTQIIGWDPRAEQIRSWSFDSSGGYGTGLWTPTPDGWAIDTVGVLPDGTPTSSRDLCIRVAGQDNVLGWRSLDRKAGDMALPDMREVVLDRIIKK